MRILPVVPDNNVRNLYFANEFTFEDLMQIRHKMDTGMDMCHSYTYVVVVTAILVFSAKDHVLLQIITWIRNLCKRGNRSRNPAIIATKESKKSSRSKQFITCKE